jgi:hypothetical protein
MRLFPLLNTTKLVRHLVSLVRAVELIHLNENVRVLEHRCVRPLRLQLHHVLRTTQRVVESSA